MTNAPTLISLSEICRDTSMSRTGINLLRATDPTFPQAVALGNRRVAFVRAEYQEWLNGRIQKRDTRAIAIRSREAA